MIKAACHCGKISVEVARAPRRLTDCNCSICRRLGALWAYYRPEKVIRHYRERDIQRYAWGERMLSFVRCRHCGCVLHYERSRRAPAGKIGVNARLFDPVVVARTRVRRLDGASTWKFLD